jgi:hypothetical protein
MMAMARTGDPAAAAEEERAKRRDGMRASRAAHVGRPLTMPARSNVFFQDSGNSMKPRKRNSWPS